MLNQNHKDNEHQNLVYDQCSCHVCVCVSVYGSMCVYVCTRAHVFMCVVCMNMMVYVCVCGNKWVYMHVYMHIYVYVGVVMCMHT